jgi:3-deoxy-manno-octulosonate cytidylyltransferase (CMP-KDO synthetase)
VIPGLLGVIPARLESSRLPRKPLHPLAGRPLIEWVWRRAAAADIFEVLLVATDSEEIAAVVRGFGGTVELTDRSHPSGTDRVAEVARHPRYRRYPLLVNVQGDEPFLRRGDLESAARLVAEDGWEVGTVASPIRSREELEDPAVVKVIRTDSGRALYFSRALIPYSRDSAPSAADLERGRFLRHVGLYAYRREALLRWVALPEADLERTEKLEQLRPLVAGMEIGVGIVPPGDGGIDTPADAARAEHRLLHYPHTGVPG